MQKKTQTFSVRAAATMEAPLRSQQEPRVSCSRTPHTEQREEAAPGRQPCRRRLPGRHGGEEDCGHSRVAPLAYTGCRRPGRIGRERERAERRERGEGEEEGGRSYATPPMRFVYHRPGHMDRERERERESAWHHVYHCPCAPSTIALALALGWMLLSQVRLPPH